MCFAVIALFFCLPLLLMGCGDVKPELPPIVPPSQVVFRATENPPSLDPARAARTFDGHLVCLIHGGLLRSAPDGSVQTELAEKWEVDRHGRRIRFFLKKGLRFPSGRMLSPEDVRYSFSRVCRPEMASPLSWVFEDVVGYAEVRSGEEDFLAGIHIVDATTVEIEVEEPSATLAARLTMPVTRIVDRTETEKQDTSYGRSPRGLGAWELLEWVDDSHITLRPNPLYPGRNRNLSSLRFNIVPQDFTASALFETGGLHVLDPLPVGQAARWRKSSFWRSRIETVPQYNLYYLGFGCHRPPFDRVEIRSAIRSAIGVQEIGTALYQNRVVFAGGPVPPGLIGHKEDRDTESRDETKTLETDRMMGELKGLEVDLWFIDSDSTVSLAMEAVQADLAKTGLKCRLRRTDPTTYHSWRREGRFDLFFANWWADYPDPDNFLFPLFHSGSASNSVHLSDPEVDRLIQLARQQPEPEKRRDLYHRVISRLNRLAPAVFLWHRNSEVLIHPEVKGYTPPRLFQGTLYLNLRVEGELGTAGG